MLAGWVQGVLLVEQVVQVTISIGRLPDGVVAALSSILFSCKKNIGGNTKVIITSSRAMKIFALFSYKIRIKIH